MFRILANGVCLAALMLASHAAQAAEAEQCKTVRMAEPGWNDLAFTTGVANVLLEALGYQPQSQVLGINVIYEGMKNRDLDLFLGYWDPAMVTYYEPYKKDGSVENVRVNLVGAKYTFAVPTYAWDAGVKDISDLHKFADKFGKKMYGIEPGSNQLMMDAIADPAFGLDGWQVVESSEAGMLSEVGYEIKEKQFIVFQGWAPHPMNTMYDFKYLTGGDKFFGPNFGAATVTTQVRKGYLEQCPNVAQFLRNLVFDIDFENVGMGYLINDGMKPEDGALKAIMANKSRLDAWLAGVTTFDGKPGLAAVKEKLGL
ncbi:MULTISPECIES: choline ABC transporter substrate-binding protein [unclassified Mesorhizobium]|uniref:choline ABC transporter substrate-binding protein n=1 Tax=unclassified Mesorhizobium TaxID=325217 RepID=UPI0003CFFEA3|nr:MULTISPECIES: choline ABC transporter substrate-binding protein [unclassified Mesorhizobium]ESZ20643.1 glycine/betaine ABC transporter substrate-binding protein [Mesorhizobium sp. L2C084A000]RUW87001.1 choline ABC transporter substrate-binding protein [Mesorhizobium sp. M7A.F.Ca.US.010.02.1.1]